MLCMLCMLCMLQLRSFVAADVIFLYQPQAIVSSDCGMQNAAFTDLDFDIPTLSAVWRLKLAYVQII